jgi:hypothetical protein
MGTLTKYDLRKIPCDIFVETGTGSGASLLHALHSGRFRKLFSVEIHRESADKASELFSKHSQVKIYNSDSESALRNIFKQVESSDCLFFFLDAHFPGEFGAHFKGYGDSVPDRITLPLEHELDLIQQHRPLSQDLIVVDDLRLYEQGPFERGNLPSGFANMPDAIRNLHFLPRIFPDRHIVRDYRDEGYLFILPKGREFRFERLDPLQRVLRTLRKSIGKP